MTTTFSCSPAEDLLHSLGVTSPEEIDLDAIAYHVGVRVRYRPLTGCIARIIANGDRAIATIDENCRHERKRFSIGHELGHWGTSFVAGTFEVPMLEKVPPYTARNEGSACRSWGEPAPISAQS